MLSRVVHTAFKDERFGLKLFVCERLCVGTSYQYVLKAVAVRCASDIFPSSLSQPHIPSFVVAVGGLRVCVKACLH